MQPLVDLLLRRHQDAVVDAPQIEDQQRHHHRPEHVAMQRAPAQQGQRGEAQHHRGADLDEIVLEMMPGVLGERVQHRGIERGLRLPQQLLVVRGPTALAQRHHDREPERDPGGDPHAPHHARAVRHGELSDQRVDPPRREQRHRELQQDEDHHRHPERVEEGQVMEQEPVQRLEVLPERDQQRRHPQQRGEDAEPVEHHHQADAREEQRQDPHVVGIVGEGLHAADVGRAAEARRRRHEEGRELGRRERPARGVRELGAALGAAAAHRVLLVVLDRQEQESREAGSERVGRDQARAVAQDLGGAGAGLDEARRVDHVVQPHGDPGVIDDLDVGAQHLESQGQRQPAQVLHPPALEQSLRQP